LSPAIINYNKDEISLRASERGIQRRKGREREESSFHLLRVIRDGIVIDEALGEKLSVELLEDVLVVDVLEHQNLQTVKLISIFPQAIRGGEKRGTTWASLTSTSLSLR